MNRTLVLHREHLAPLSDDELGTVVGGPVLPSRDCPPYSHYRCLTDPSYCGFESLTCVVAG